MKRRVVAVGVLAAALSVGLAAPGQAVVRQPKTLAGAIAAVRHSGQGATIVLANSTAASARRGAAELAIGFRGDRFAACAEDWGYTGTRWGLLGQCTQDLNPDQFNLPARLWICRGATGTVVRTGPGPRFAILTKVRRNTVVRADQLKLTLPGRETFTAAGRDGVGWYRVRVGRRVGWVASYRVMAATSSGFARSCSDWRGYWARVKHR